MNLFGKKNEDLVEPAGVTANLVVQLFRDAFLEATLDSDGRVKVVDGYRCFVSFDEKERFVRFRCAIRTKEDAANEARLKYVNRINDEYIVVRATNSDGCIAYDYYLVIEGGVAKKNIVHALRRFTSALRSAVDDDAEGVLQ